MVPPAVTAEVVNVEEGVDEDEVEEEVMLRFVEIGPLAELSCDRMINGLLGMLATAAAAAAAAAEAVVVDV